MQQSGPEGGDAGVCRPVRILLAEDTPISAQMMEVMARHLGVDLDIAANGAEANALHRRAPASERSSTPLLLDVMLRGLGGSVNPRALRALGRQEARRVGQKGVS